MSSTASPNISPGGFVCVRHGGAAPQVRAKAAWRLAAAREERKLERRLGRPLTPAEAAYLTGDMAAWRREVRSQLRQLRADAEIALARLRNTLET
jgi:hypothetical protein